MSDDRWLTPRQAAERLGVSVSLVRLMLRDGRLQGRRLRGSRLVRIAVEDLDALLEPLPPRAAASASGRLRLVEK